MRVTLKGHGHDVRVRIFLRIRLFNLEYDSLVFKQSSVLRPSLCAAKPRDGEGLAKLALDCVFTDQSDFTEAIRSNCIHSLRG